MNHKLSVKQFESDSLCLHIHKNAQKSNSFLKKKEMWLADIKSCFITNRNMYMTNRNMNAPMVQCDGMDMWNTPMVQSRQPLTYRWMESVGLGGPK